MVSLFYNKLIDYILNNNDPCSLYCQKNNKDQKEIKIDSKFLSFNQLSSLLCIFDGVFNITKNTNFKNEDINKWITNIKYLARTKESIVYQANFSDQDILIIKNVNSNMEYFIGIFCTNKLRQLIPNFAYVLGTFKLFGYDDQKINIIYEKIPGLTFEQIIQTKKLSYKDCLNYFIQILLSLLVSQNEYGYTHNDLHTNNIIIRDVIGEQTIKYFVNGTIYSINTNKIATIIDYGQSQFVYDGIFINGIIILPGKDLYTLIYNLMDNLFFYDRSLYKQMNWILDFYKDDKYHFYKFKNDNQKMTQLTEYGNSVHYVLKSNDKECYINLQKYIDFIINKTKDIIITNEHFPKDNLLCGKKCDNISNLKFKTHIINNYRNKLLNKEEKEVNENIHIDLAKNIDSNVIFKINNELNNIEQKLFNYDQVKLLINKFVVENIKLLNLKDQAETYIKYGTVLQELDSKISLDKYKTIYWIININKRINQLIGSLFAILIREYYKTHNYYIKKILQEELSRYNVSDINTFMLKNL